jgi:hypothetical protein
MRRWFWGEMRVLCCCLSVLGGSSDSQSNLVGLFGQYVEDREVLRAR